MYDTYKYQCDMKFMRVSLNLIQVKYRGLNYSIRMIRWILLLCYVYVTTAHETKLHEHMTKDEIESVFHVKHNEIHELEYEVTPIVHYEKVRVNGQKLPRLKPTVHLRAFDQQYTLYLEENKHVLIGNNTPVFLAKPNMRRSADSDVIYSRIQYPLPSSLKLYHDLEKRAAVTVFVDDDKKAHVNGIIGDDLVISPLPARVHKEVLTRYPSLSRPSSSFKYDPFYDDSIDDFDDDSIFLGSYLPTHHVVIKPNTQVNSAYLNPIRPQWNQLPNWYKNDDESNGLFNSWPKMPREPVTFRPITKEPYTYWPKSQFTWWAQPTTEKPFTWWPQEPITWWPKPTTGKPFTWWPQEPITWRPKPTTEKPYNWWPQEPITWRPKPTTEEPYNWWPHEPITWWPKPTPEAPNSKWPQFATQPPNSWWSQFATQSPNSQWPQFPTQPPNSWWSQYTTKAPDTWWSQFVTKKPSTWKPSSTETPVTLQTVTKQPFTVRPTTKQSVTIRPTTKQSITIRPTTKQSVTIQPTTKQSVTVRPTTEKPVTSRPTSKPTEAPETQSDIVYPELLIAVDHDTYATHGNSIEEVSKYMAAFWNAVDLRYREMEHPKVRLNIAGLIIPQQRDGTPYMERHRHGKEALYAEETVREIGSYFAKDEKFPKNSYDIVVGITHRDLGSDEEDGHFKDGTTGIAMFKGACQVKSGNAAALVRDKGGFNGITTAAHELAHSLGAPHDGDDSAKVPGGPCPWADGYLMSYNRKDSKGMHWSKCSMKAMELFMESSSGECLKNKPNVGTPYPKLLPGRLFSRDEQCNRSLGMVSYKEKADDCAVLWCAKYEETPRGTQISGLTEYRPPAEGSYCGEGKICLDAKCVKDPEA